MKRCPSCNRTYPDEALNYCLEDGTPLTIEAPAAGETSATMRYTPPRDTSPPPTEIYRPQQPASQSPPPFNQPAPFQPQPQWSPMPMAQPRKSNAVWWILGGLAVVTILGVGLIIILIALASMSSDSNNNRTVANTNNINNANRSVNVNRTANANNTNTNTSAKPPAHFTDDFSTQEWGTGSSQYGETSYVNQEYHMHSRDKTYLVMYAPNNPNYYTENATVRVTVRNVDGVSPTYGYGLLVHAAKSKDKGELEDYAFLIRTDEKPSFKVLMHKGGTETPVVSWTASSAIRPGTSPNQLEVRIRDKNLAFYINGQYATSITDDAPFKRGLAGFYTSDAHEVAFDDLEFSRQ